MSNVYQLSSQEGRFDEASMWISRLDRGMSAEEYSQLQQWLSESQENVDIFLKVAEAWDKTEILSKLADLFPEPVSNGVASRWFNPAMVATMAIFLLTAIWGLVFFSAPMQSDLVPNVQGIYKTAIGEHSTINLPDGTQLVLNTNSLVRVSYTERQRVLELERGEMHVDVFHDESRPLSVVARDQVFQAVGTAFNIELHSDQRIELVVTEGKVLVGIHARETDSEGQLKPIVLPTSSVAVSGGQQLMVGAPQEEVELIEPDEIEIKLSWRQGNLIFRGESLEEAIAEISRYTSVEFVLLDENLKKIRVVGLFKAGDVTGLLTTLKDNFNITHKRLDEKVILSQR